MEPLGARGSQREPDKAQNAGLVGTRLPSAIFAPIENWAKRKLRRPSRSDDADHRVLASIQACNRRRVSSLFRDPRAFLSPAQDAFGLRDSSERIRSLAASDDVHLR